MKKGFTIRIASKTNTPNFIGVENDPIFNEVNIWYYPYNMRGWEGFLGQWRIKSQ